MSVGAASLCPTLPHLLRRPSIPPSPTLSLHPLLLVAASSPLSSSSRPQTAHALPLSASGRRRGRQSVKEDDDVDVWAEEMDEEEEEEEEEENDGDEAPLPFREMRQWFRNKPAGFGEGKTYDTTLEDELWEEMERTRKTQLANLNKLQNESKKRQQSRQKATDAGTRVHIWNLPRKKNIHRDLQRAFKGFPGLVNINPAVMGNEKTRDPICKGFAFVDFASKAAATKFVQVYSRRSLQFGKVEKQIACSVINPHNIFNSSELLDGDTLRITEPEYIKPGDEMHSTCEIEILSPDSQERTFDDGFPGVRVIDVSEVEPMSPKRKIDGPSTHLEESENDHEHYNIFFLDNVGNESEMIIKNSSLKDSVPPMQKERKMASSKKKASKTSLPGSIARLKNKDRTVLNGVFSKYTGKVAVES